MALRIGEWLPGYGDDGDELRLACGDELVAEQFELRIEARATIAPMNSIRRTRVAGLGIRYVISSMPVLPGSPRWSSLLRGGRTTSSSCARLALSFPPTANPIALAGAGRS